MPSTELTCRRFLVTGRVQGVGFRFATMQTARELSLSGHVRNLEDGSVEVIACGSASAVSELEVWLQQGPPLAQVREVLAENATTSHFPARFTLL